MKKMFALLFATILLTGCAADLVPTVTATPTPEPTSKSVVGAAEALLLQNMQYQMTRDAAVAQQEAAGAAITMTAIVEANAATAAAQVKSERATQQMQAKQERATQQAQERIDAATAQARADTATQNAVIAAQTQQAWEATVTAAVVGTQTAFPMTMTALPIHSTAEAASLLAQGTEQAGSAELTNLTVKRQTMKNGLDAFLPWTLIVSGFIIGSLSIVIFTQYRQLKRDRNGLLGGEVVKHKNGVTVIRPDNMTGAAMTINKQGQVTEAGSVSDFQQQTTRRQQLREASIGKTLPEFRQIVGMFGQPPAGNATGVIYFDADRVLSKILRDAEEDMVDGEVTDV